jgi:hypothetical protein
MNKEHMATINMIFLTVQDLVANFLYYDRKEDEDLPRGVIEKMIEDKILTVDELALWFHSELNRVLKD